jgi:DNA-binding LacI/PurR family transcriptional regulator
MISIEKIAKEAKVSSMTVSRVLDPRHVNKVKPSTRERVMSICKKHDYSPRYSARSLASGKTFNVGLVLNDFASGLTSPTMSLVIDSIIKELEKHSYSLNMIYCQGDSIDEMNERLISIIYSRRVDGFLLFGEMLTDASVEKLKKTSIPAVILSMPSSRTLQENISYVYADNTPATYDAVNHLKSIGIEEAVYISSVNIGNYCIDRADMFDTVALDYGLKIERLTCDYKYRHLKAIYDSFSWVNRNWKLLEKRDAYVFTNDLMAVGGIEALKLKGIIPGKDKAIIGFDNIEENANYGNSEPVLTTIAPPLADLGKESAKLLLKQIQNNEVKSLRLGLPSRLIIRQSTKR